MTQGRCLDLLWVLLQLDLLAETGQGHTEELRFLRTYLPSEALQGRGRSDEVLRQVASELTARVVRPLAGKTGKASGESRSQEESRASLYPRRTPTPRMLPHFGATEVTGEVTSESWVREEESDELALYRARPRRLARALGLPVEDFVRLGDVPREDLMQWLRQHAEPLDPGVYRVADLVAFLPEGGPPQEKSHEGRLLQERRPGLAELVAKALGRDGDEGE